MIGASIGANLSLQYLARYPEFKKAVLLSPGLNYRGLRGEALAKKLRGDQRVLVVASKDDERSGGNATEAAQAIFEALAAKEASDILIYEDGGHGTDLLLGRDSEVLTSRLAAFIVGSS